MFFSQELPRTIPHPPQKLRVSIQDEAAVETMGSHLAALLHLLNPLHKRQPVLLGIGTDRSTGDSLGPLVGSRLNELSPGLLPIYGTLDEPVHAINLQEKLGDIAKRHPLSLIIAVDACLGQLQNVGSITLGSGSLHPGTGVHKDLPPVGDLFISGVVNIGGFLEYLVLQNTRLGLVMKMSDRIARAMIISLAG